MNTKNKWFLLTVLVASVVIIAAARYSDLYVYLPALGFLYDAFEPGGAEARAETTGKNHLANQKSPYLLQHADNPVDWYPWGDEAFNRAKKENKPIFLSIGYSTCHWCHVMERDSFENELVAAIINKYFISIKVDREERPDIDAIYMKVCQAMTGGGGWPLTIVMTPDRKPFFAGTFFPADDNYGRKGLKTILREIADLWESNHDRVQASADNITQAVQTKQDSEAGVQLDEKTLKHAFDIFSANYDRQYGGFGRDGPKFPKAHEISFLLRYWKRTGDADALEMAEKTLDGIYRGGVHDHIGGGYHRYSTDKMWLVPHFEKMLYDQAILARAFLEAYQATGKQVYADAARDIFDYVLRDMTGPRGGFYSAEDADSEGEEGKFYVWTKGEIDTLLGSGAAAFEKYYGVTQSGNFERGTNILHIPDQLSESEKKNIAPALESGRKKLFAARGKRVRPSLDDKVLVSWNGLMISSLAYGSRVLGEPRYAEAAEKAAGFIMSGMWKDGRLLRRYRDGEAGIPGFVDDYAFLDLALVDLYEATFDLKWIADAKKVADLMLKLFRDDDSGGLLFSADDNEQLPGTVRDAYDGAEPSGNSIAALALLKLAKLTMNSEYESAGREIINAFSAGIASYPVGFAQMLQALDFEIGPSMEIVIVGNSSDPFALNMLEVVDNEYLPSKILVFYPKDKPAGEIESVIPYTEMKEMIGGSPTAFVCSNFTCKFPTNDINQLRKLLSADDR